MPSVLCCSGLDPTGGAGIQADIQAIGSAGVHACALVTALTEQDTSNVRAVNPVPVEVLDRQAALLRADCEFQAVKLGLVGSADQLPWLEQLLMSLNTMVVMDPVLRAGGGKELVDSTFEQEMKARLFPHCHVLTPNAAEARRLADCEDLDTAGRRLLEMGAAHILITGGDEQGDIVENRWYRRGEAVHIERWPRLPGHYHGAGCTLAAAIAAQLALGQPVGIALQRAQAYTFRALQQAAAVGRGRLIPMRQFDFQLPGA